MAHDASTPLLRPMTFADCAAVAAVRVLGWQHAYAGLVPQSHLDALDLDRETELRRTQFGAAGPGTVNLVAERAGEVVGWACWGPYRTDGEPARPAHAELYALYVRPDHLSCGAGRALTTACVAGARAAGFTSLSLWVLARNDRARRFYEKAGFVCDGVEEPFELDGALVPEVRYTSRLSEAAAAARSLG
ncbi:N-acetyltransferase family protein [Streptomyces sp. CA-294286]|uniref:GNAT family N-acetyltransferase n=1 Tax=Streptomyces sp. CA-294286 TaxID=3240070 RepID=UPI003D8FDDA0